MAASIKLISPAGGSVTLTAPMTTDNFSFDIGGGTSLATLNVSNSLAVGANLNFTGTSQRITGDFTNTLIPSRVIFQTSNTNSSTGIYAVPSGSSTAASWQAANTADPTNASKILIATNGSTDVQLVSGVNGTGTYLPLTFYNGGSERMRLSNTGNFSIGTANTDTYKLNVNGSANISGTLTVNGTNITGAGGSGFSNLVTITANTDWTIPTGITKAKVTVIAGGGGGGGVAGAGGGAGGTGIKYYTNLVPGQTANVIIGGGGAGGAASSVGTAGRASSFNASSVVVSTTGGAGGGINGNAGGAGGSASGGDFNILGGTGGQGASSSWTSTGGCGSVTNYIYYGGAGGQSTLAGAGPAIFGTAAAAAGIAARTNSGSGGSGGTNGNGGAGASGIVIIEF